MDLQTAHLALLCSSAKSTEELVSISKKHSKKGTFVVLLDMDETLLKRLLPAYLNAYARFNEGGMRSNDIGIEIMLFLAGSMNISSAIRKVGAKSGKAFIAYSNSSKALASFVKKTSCRIVKKYALKFDCSIAGEVAIAGISEKQKMG